jgi:hypothetical protein
MSDAKTWRDHHLEDLEVHVRTHMSHRAWMDFEVYDIVGHEYETGTTLYRQRGEDMTPHVEKAEKFLTGHIKFDGCSDVNLHKSHACCREDWTRLGPLFDRLYDIAIESMEPHARQYLEKREVKP